MQRGKKGDHAYFLRKQYKHFKSSHLLILQHVQKHTYTHTQANKRCVEMWTKRTDCVAPVLRKWERWGAYWFLLNKWPVITLKLPYVKSVYHPVCVWMLVKDMLLSRWDICSCACSPCFVFAAYNRCYRGKEQHLTCVLHLSICIYALWSCAVHSAP